MSEAQTFFDRPVRAVHCIGVTGMGLGPLAIYLAGLGLRVTGEDDSPNELVAQALASAGIGLGATGTVPEGVDLVVISSAVKAGHPSLLTAEARAIPVRRRGEVLAEVTASRRLIAVCGSHGKTTTTALLVTALRAASLPFGYILGGLFGDTALPPAAAGSGDWIVAEVDESDGTIERYHPDITVAVNIDWDHPDQYPTRDACLEAFARLFTRTRSTVLVNSACANTRDALARLQAPAAAIRSFGPGGDFALISTESIPSGQRLRLGGQFSTAEVSLPALGAFNASNATAALAAAQVAGASLRSDLLAAFPGVLRRQSRIAASGGVTVVEDYAHHPAEIRALLASLRIGLSPGQRLFAVFQPHRFSRTLQFIDGFAESLAGVDWLGLIDVYGAGEEPISGGTTGDLYALVRSRFPRLDVNFCGPHTDRLLALLSREVRAGDFVAWIGAGDIDRTAREWVDRFASHGADVERWDNLAAGLQRILSSDTRVRRDEPLSARTTMRVGGAARVWVEPASEDDVRLLVGAAHEAGVPLLWLGRGSNLVVPDSGVDGIVASLTHAAWQVFEPQPDGRVWVGAGLRLKNLCGLAAKAGLRGFEFLEGIPGNVGGALRMNAGAMGGWMFNVVDAVRMLVPPGRVVVKSRAEMSVDYRHCADLDDAIALGAWLKPAADAASPESVNAAIEAYRDKRQKSQPREPSAGCIFKNPEGDHAGRLIDTAGLKGLRVGGAEVSPVHANFIVNADNATSADVAELVRRVRRAVEERHGVRLDPEVILFGDDWNRFL